MGYRIRQIGPKTKFNDAFDLEAITPVIPLETIRATLQECGSEEQRERRLPAWLTVLVCIGMNPLISLFVSEHSAQFHHQFLIIEPNQSELWANLPFINRIAS